MKTTEKRVLLGRIVPTATCNESMCAYICVCVFMWCVFGVCGVVCVYKMCVYL